MESNPDVSWYAGLQAGTADPVVVVAVMEGGPSSAAEIGRKMLVRALSNGS
jgi:hypothetical protein